LKLKNSDILEPIPLAIVMGETVLSDEALERQIQLGHSCWLTLNKHVRLFSGIKNIRPDGKSADIYWLTLHEDDKVTDPDHWLRTATREDKYNFALQSISDLDPKFQEVVMLSKAEAMKDIPLIFWDALIEDLPTSRVTLLGDAIHPMSPCKNNLWADEHTPSSCRLVSDLFHFLSLSSPWRRRNQRD
jgi:hypothetical protein